MKIATEELIKELIECTQTHISAAKKFKSYSVEMLNKRKSPTSWSVLECLEHLNLYGDYYIPTIKKSIESSSSQSTTIFKTGILGNYFANSMKPKAKLNKMATFKDKNPLGKQLNWGTIDRFLDQQNSMLELLDLSRKVDLNKVKVPISITKFIKLKLGDTFRFVIFHNERHIFQASQVN